MPARLASPWISHLHDTVCIVTGSTGGIGLEVARLLAAEGAPVVTTGRRASGPGVGETLHVAADLPSAARPNGSCARSSSGSAASTCSSTTSASRTSARSKR